MENTDHIEAINRLIPEAITIADKATSIYCEKYSCNSSHPIKLIKGRDGVTFNYDVWTEHFHEAMNRLAVRAGLRTILS